MQLKKLIPVLQFAFIILGLIVSNYGYSKTENIIKKLDRIIAIVDQDVITNRTTKKRSKKNSKKWPKLQTKYRNKEHHYQLLIHTGTRIIIDINIRIKTLGA